MVITRFHAVGLGALFLLLPLAVTAPAFAQEGSTKPGRTAQVGGVEIGERQTREEGATNGNPLLRISNRIQNRVQTRIRNRIDRNYDPQANVTSPFEVAVEQSDAAKRRLQRR